MRARTVNESLSPAEKREEVMRILTDMDIEVPHDSYLKFMELCKTNLPPRKIVRKILKESAIKNSLKGGKGDKVTEKDVCPKQFAVGKKVEKEHGSSAEKAKEIALDHLAENPKYYSELVEKGFVDEGPAIKEYIKQFGKNKLPKKLQENVSFHKGQDPKKSMNIGVDAKVMNFLEWVKNDFQLDKSNKAEYMGFINLADDMFSDEAMDLKEGHRLFVDDYEKYLPVMADMGLYMLERPWPDYEETIIYDDKVLTDPDYKVYSVLESVNFERGQEPKGKMGVGINNYLGYVKHELSTKYPGKDLEKLEKEFWELFNDAYEDMRSYEVGEAVLDILEHTPLKFQMEFMDGDLESFDEAIEEGWITI